MTDEPLDFGWRTNARLEDTATMEEAAAAIAWLRDQLDAKLAAARDARDEFRRIELLGLLFILDRHTPEDVDERDQRIWRCRAKCRAESWKVCSDGQLVVRAPCQTVLALAMPYAILPDFPEALRDQPA